MKQYGAHKIAHALHIAYFRSKITKSSKNLSKIFRHALILLKEFV